MTRTWIVTAGARYGGLVDLAVGIGAPVTVVALGDIPVPERGIEHVLRLVPAADQPVEASAPAVARCVTAGDGDVVLVVDEPSSRVLAGALAAALAAPVLSGVVQVSSGVFTCARHGGIALESVRVTGPVVVVASGGAAVEGPTTGGEVLDATGYDARVTGTAPAQTASVDLASARRIVAAGRGFRAEVDLALARDLATALGAELACTRPLAEGQDWLPRDRYVGVSGQRVSPDLYVAVGVSGQLQHMSGVGGAKTIVAVNSDASAPVFGFADYGVVGDLYDVLPALSAALR